MARKGGQRALPFALYIYTLSAIAFYRYLRYSKLIMKMGLYSTQIDLPADETYETSESSCSEGHFVSSPFVSRAAKPLRLAIAADHAGYEVKEFIKQKFIDAGYTIHDYGAFTPDRVDYPDMASAVCRGILSGDQERGILVCGTGIGMSIMANRFKGIRCALCHNTTYVELARSHNDANVLALGGRYTTPEEAWDMTQLFIETPFLGGRHAVRIAQLDI